MVSIRPKALAKKLQLKNTPLVAQIQVLKQYQLRVESVLPPEDRIWLHVTIANLEKEFMRRKKKPAK